MADHTSDASGPPDMPQDSVGSSVSSRFQDEYEELLKYAVVVPKVDFAGLPNMLTDSNGSFRSRTSHARFKETSKDDSGDSYDSDETPRRAHVPQRNLAPQRQAAQQEAPQREQLDSRRFHDHQASTCAPAPDSDESPLPVRPSAQAYTGGWSAAARSPPPPSPSVNTGRNQQQQRDRGLAMLQSPMLFGAGCADGGGMDDDIHTMETKLDLWCRDLKTNIVEEVARMKIKLMEQNRHAMEQMTYKHEQEMQTKQNDIEGMKELLHTYETSIERKDAVIANLTRSLENQREKFDVLRNFTEWKLQFYSRKQEGYATRLALKQCRLFLLRKAWRSWHVIIEQKWRQRVEKACQSKAQEVCMALTNDYETRLASINEALEGARLEVARLHKEREAYEENMKKAFMRGVCALNLEAMNIFHEPSADSKDNDTQSTNEGSENVDPLGETSRPLVIQQEPVYSVGRAASAAERHQAQGGDQRQHASRGGRRSTCADLHQRPRATASYGKKPSGMKQLTARLVAQPDGCAGGRMARPESLTGLGQVVVECHRDVNEPQMHEPVMAAAPQPKQKPVPLPVTKTVKIVK